MSAIAAHISSAGANTLDDLSAAVVFPPYWLDHLPVCANLVISTNEAAMLRRWGGADARYRHITSICFRLQML
jgi:hypothetical protein